MCRSLCLFAFFALSFSFAHSWDLAMTTEDQIEFYTNQTKSNTVKSQFRNMTALAYDAVNNMLLFVDKQSDNASIFSYHLATKKYQFLVRRKYIDDIQGLAFDAVKGVLFWTDATEKSIFWMSLIPGTKNNLSGNLLIKMVNEIPRAIAVDSCRGYIYWTNTNIIKPTIERARFDGSERTVIVGSDIYMPVSIAVDQRTKRLYWIDDREGIYYSIESSDLEGHDRKTLLADAHHVPNALTVSKNSIYWIDWGYKTVWRLPKNPPTDAVPEEFIVFHEKPFGIAANYKIADQIEGSNECEALKNIEQNNASIIQASHVLVDIGASCVQGTIVNGTTCKCSPGYVGKQCETSVCHNWCFNGDCSFTPDDIPKCRCKDGYTGARCEVHKCYNHCLNGGICSLNKQIEPQCTCTGDFKGAKCEQHKVQPSTVAPCNCTVDKEEVENLTVPYAVSDMREPGYVEAGCNGWDSVRDPVIMVLGIACGLMCAACAVLFTKVVQLKKRPRIRKRIIVNKNVTPMTARPDQCEITIENCCNMNICETPCFEPRSNIRPSLLGSKSGKEEKKNLIANIEYPDDY